MLLSNQSSSIPLFFYSRQLLFQYLSPVLNFVCSIISYKWHHTEHVLPLASFTQRDSFEIYSSYYVFILFYCWVVFYCMNIPLFFFYMFSFDGHLYCFQFLAIMNSQMNILVQVFLYMRVSISVGYIPMSGVSGP